VGAGYEIRHADLKWAGAFGGTVTEEGQDVRPEDALQGVDDYPVGAKTVEKYPEMVLVVRERTGKNEGVIQIDETEVGSP
jgi:hypothetical protein